MAKVTENQTIFGDAMAKVTDNRTTFGDAMAKVTDNRTTFGDVMTMVTDNRTTFGDVLAQVTENRTITFEDVMSNLSEMKSTTDGAANYLLGSWYTVSSILIIATNAVVIFVIMRTKSLHLPTLWVIAHMALWDMVIGLDGLFVMAPCAFYGRFIFPESSLGFSACFNTFILGQNLFNMFMIVADRFIAIKFPLSYARIATKLNYALATLLTMVLNFLRVSLIAFADHDYYFHPLLKVCVFNFDNLRNTIPSVLPVLIVLLMIIVCSCVVLKDILRSRQRHKDGGGSGVRVPYLKFPLMVVLSAAVFCLSYFPTFAAVLWNFFEGQGSATNMLLVLASITQMSSSVWNVLIYTATYAPFRESLAYLFCRSYYRQMMRSKLGIHSDSSTKLTDNSLVVMS